MINVYSLFKLLTQLPPIYEAVKHVDMVVRAEAFLSKKPFAIGSVLASYPMRSYYKAPELKLFSIFCGIWVGFLCLVVLGFLTEQDLFTWQNH